MILYTPLSVHDVSESAVSALKTVFKKEDLLPLDLEICTTGDSVATGPEPEMREVALLMYNFALSSMSASSFIMTSLSVAMESRRVRIFGSKSD